MTAQLHSCAQAVVAGAHEKAEQMFHCHLIVKHCLPINVTLRPTCPITRNHLNHAYTITNAFKQSHEMSFHRGTTVSPVSKRSSSFNGKPMRTAATIDFKIGETAPAGLYRHSRGHKCPNIVKNRRNTISRCGGQPAPLSDPRGLALSPLQP